MVELVTYAFIVTFISGVIYSLARSALVLCLKEEAPDVWKTWGYPLGPRDGNSKFVSWLIFRRYQTATIPEYLKSYFGALRILQIIMFASMAAFLFLIIANLFVPKIESG